MIKFACQFCGNLIYAEDSDAGSLVSCPNDACAQAIEVPNANDGLSGNPFYRPIVTFSESIQRLRFFFPYLQVIQLLITCFILVVLAILFATVGIAAQIASMFQRLIQEAQVSMQRAQAAERTGYAVAIGIYRLLLFPFWLVQLPVRVLASILEHPASATIVVVMGIVAVYLHGWHPDWWTALVIWCRDLLARWKA